MGYASLSPLLVEHLKISMLTIALIYKVANGNLWYKCQCNLSIYGMLISVTSNSIYISKCVKLIIVIRQFKGEYLVLYKRHSQAWKKYEFLIRGWGVRGVKAIQHYVHCMHFSLRMITIIVTIKASYVEWKILALSWIPVRGWGKVSLLVCNCIMHFKHDISTR